MDLRGYELLASGDDEVRLWCDRCPAAVASTDVADTDQGVTHLTGDVTLADLLGAATRHDHVHRAARDTSGPGRAS